MDTFNQDPKQADTLMKRPLPNSSASLVLGIASIVLCWCYGIISIIFGIIGLILGAKSITLFRESLGVYTHVSYGNAVAGKICSIIGLILGILFLAWIIIFVGAYKDQLLPHIQSIIEEGGYNF